MKPGNRVVVLRLQAKGYRPRPSGGQCGSEVQQPHCMTETISNSYMPLPASTTFINLMRPNGQVKIYSSGQQMYPVWTHWSVRVTFRCMKLLTRVLTRYWGYLAVAVAVVGFFLHNIGLAVTVALALAALGCFLLQAPVWCGAETRCPFRGGLLPAGFYAASRSLAGSGGSQGLPARAVLTALRAVRPWAVAESR